MAKIQVMDNHLANMIKAGEVIEKPASVIKELVENSIDANATIIKIEVNQVGLESIIITDNGDGIEKDQIHLAFLRHATSKLTSKDQLFQISTLGFRGEALPSIASVATVKLESRTLNNDPYMVVYQDNLCINEGITQLNYGTRVTVEKLFLNTPARFKYLKSEFSEKKAIIDLFDKLALSRKDISFTLIFDGKEVKKTKGNNDVFDLVDDVIGKNLTEGIKYVKQNLGKISIESYLISPHFTKSNKKDIHLFINHRPIRNYVLTNSIIEAYNTFLMTNRYPIVLCYINLDSSLVDVNCHPQKLEVKLANELMIAYQLKDIITKALNENKLPIRETLKEIKKDLQNDPNYSQISFFKDSDTLNEDKPKEYSNQIENSQKIPEFDFIGTFGGTYLLFQNEDGLFLIDQHAAAERIRYEYYQNKVADVKSDSYHLLIPREFNFSEDEKLGLENQKNQLKDLGFVFQDNLLIAHPSWLREEELEKAVLAIVSNILEEKEISLKSIRNQLAKDISCKGAIKANHALSSAEMKNLIKDLRTCVNPYTCPHGRPVIIKLTYRDIESMFKRIV